MYYDFSRNPGQARAFFEKNAGRLLFGTDNVGMTGAFQAAAMHDCEEKIARMRRFFEEDGVEDTPEGSLCGLKLSSMARNALYEGAFDAFLGAAEPKLVDCAAAAGLCDQTLSSASAAAPHGVAMESLLNHLAHGFRAYSSL